MRSPATPLRPRGRCSRSFPPVHVEIQPNRGAPSSVYERSSPCKKINARCRDAGLKCRITRKALDRIVECPTRVRYTLDMLIAINLHGGGYRDNSPPFWLSQMVARDLALAELLTVSQTALPTDANFQQRTSTDKALAESLLAPSAISRTRKRCQDTCSPIFYASRRAYYFCWRPVQAGDLLVHLLSAPALASASAFFVHPLVCPYERY